MTSVLAIDRLGGDPGLALAGELDVSTAPQLISELAAIASEDDVLLDLTDLTFIDSAGMRVILAFARCRNGRGRVVLANPLHTVSRSVAVVAAEHEMIEIVDRSGDSGLHLHPELTASREPGPGWAIVEPMADTE